MSWICAEWESFLLNHFVAQDAVIDKKKKKKKE